MNALLSLRRLCAAAGSVVDRLLSWYLGEPLSLAAQGHSIQPLEGRQAVNAPAIWPIPGDVTLSEYNHYYLWLDFSDGNAPGTFHVDWGDGSDEWLPDVGEHYTGGHTYSYSSNPYLATVSTFGIEPEDGSNVYTFHVGTDNVTPYTSVSQCNGYTAGGTVSLQLYADDPGNDAWWSIDWGDHGEGGNNDWNWDVNYQTASHTYGSTGEHNLTVFINDDGGSTVAYSATFDNVPPSPSVSGPSSINRSDAYALSFMTGDPGNDTSWHVDWGDGRESWFYDNASSGTFWHQYGHGGSFNVNATCYDSGGSVAAPTTSVTVAAVTPTVSAAGAASANEGATYTLGLSATNAEDTANWTIDWGDGSTPDSVPVASPSATHVFAGCSSATINASLIEGDSSFPASPVDVSITRKFQITGGSAVNEGSSYTLYLGHSAAVNGSITGWTIDWGDTSPAQAVAGNPPSVSHTYRDDCWYGYQITASATDADGTFPAEAPAYATVNNVAPTVDASGANSVNEGSPYTLSLFAGNDPGADTIDHWEINWGDGSSLQTVTGNPPSATHTYTGRTRDCTINARVYDEDGGYDAPAVNVTVNNVGPSPVLSGNSSVGEGSTYTLHLADNDPGSDGIDHWVIDWGDTNINNQADIQTVYGNPATLEHIYRHEGSYAIAATAYDSGGLSDATPAGKSITVTDADPTISVDAPGTFNTRDDYTVYLSGRDPGHDGIDHWVIDWGDQSTSTVAGSASFAAHQYASATAPDTAQIVATAYTASGAFATGDATADKSDPNAIWYALRINGSGGREHSVLGLKPEYDGQYVQLPPNVSSIQDMMEGFANIDGRGRVDFPNAFQISDPLFHPEDGSYSSDINVQVSTDPPIVEGWSVVFSPISVQITAIDTTTEGAPAKPLFVVTECGGPNAPGITVNLVNDPYVHGAPADVVLHLGGNDPTSAEVVMGVGSDGKAGWTGDLTMMVCAGTYYLVPPRFPGHPARATTEVADSDISMSVPNKVLEANYDDDNGNGTPDYLDTGTGGGDDDLYELDFQYRKDAVPGAYVHLWAGLSGGAAVKIWADQNKTRLILGPGTSNDLWWSARTDAGGWWRDGKPIDPLPNKAYLEVDHGSVAMDAVTIGFEAGQDITSFMGSQTDPAIAVTLNWVNAPAGRLGHDILVGEQVEVTVDIEAPYQLTGANREYVTLSWDEPEGKTFSQYIADSTHAVVVPISGGDLGFDTLGFHWSEAGHFGVSCNVSVSGKEYHPGLTFNVLEPGVWLCVPALKTATVNSAQEEHRLSAWLRMGQYPSSPGIRFYGAVAPPVELPTAGGQWEYVQLSSPSRWEVERKDNPILAKTFISRANGLTGLDTTYPYGFIRPTVADTAPADDSWWEASDAPGSPLTDEWSEVGRADSFDMYLMYKPATAGSAWVPLYKVHWWWKATARWETLSLNQPSWELVPGSNQQGVGNPERTSDHPIWSENMVVPFDEMIEAPAGWSPQ